MHIYKYIQLYIIFLQHVSVSLVTIRESLITRIQLLSRNNQQDATL